ncbi:glycosyltransferase family 2 protein [Xanthobacter sp. TB0136]|uniref:glycosyltransferase family 2 protein n=1 Tax=Xanthobacter sp. TB0136 TaxID=3459177 RepID=UPI004039DB8C
MTAVPAASSSSPTLADVTVVFVTYNSAAVILRAVASVPAACAVVIVDNASPRGTAWQKELTRPATVLDMGRNAGFGTACNAGARAAQTRFVMFLNPDATLEEEALPRLLAACATYGEPLILMPAMADESGRLMRKEGTIFEKVPRSARLKEAEIAGDYCTRFVHGGAFLVSRETFEDLGGFDEQIFLYHEDDDLSLRALARKVAITVVPGARVMHAQGGSSTPGMGQTFRINRFKQQSENYVRAKYGRSGSRFLRACKLAGGCVLALCMLNLHRFMVRAGKLRGLFDPVAAPHRK